MKRWAMTVLAVVSLAGCSNPAERAERDLATVKTNGGTKREICDAARKVADAYLKMDNSAVEYGRAKTEAYNDCEAAGLSS